MSRKLNEKIKSNLYGVLISGFGMGLGIGMAFSNLFSLVDSITIGAGIAIIGYFSVFGFMIATFWSIGSFLYNRVEIK
jgi:hypothetical protein